MSRCLRGPECEGDRHLSRLHSTAIPPPGSNRGAGLPVNRVTRLRSVSGRHVGAATNSSRASDPWPRQKLGECNLLIGWGRALSRHFLGATMDEKQNYCEADAVMDRRTGAHLSYCHAQSDEHYRCRHFWPDVLIPSQCGSHACGYCTSSRARDDARRSK